jgi:hypothetical protein
MSKHRSNPARKDNADNIDSRDRASPQSPAGKKPPDNNLAEQNRPIAHPANPAGLHKFFLVLTILCEIVWIIFLVILAATK